MDFIDQLRVLATRIENTKSMVQTEEATKNAMIMPLIQALGYNVFDPLEVTPELVADVGTKKGEKVDYAILRDGKPIILFECKKCGEELNINHASQLFRYFHVTEARFGVLTNGLIYRFYTDLEKPNKMDEKAFFEFNILDFKERDVEELRKFAKTSFDVDTILSNANDLKYTRSIQSKLAIWQTNPPEEIVRLLSTDLIGTKRFTPAVIDQFTTITKYAFEQFLNEQINERLKGAMIPEVNAVIEKNIISENLETQKINNSSNIITTGLEVEGFHIIRAIVRSIVSTKRVIMRDAQSYCSIIFDDNNRKSICRLRFNNTEKLKFGYFNSDKEEQQVNLDSIDDIYTYADQIRATVASYIESVESTS